MSAPAGILALLASLVNLLSRILPLRRTAPRISPRQRAIAEAHRARAASAAGDAQDVNARVERHRMRSGLPLLLCALLLSGCAGCRTSRRATWDPDAAAPDPVPAVVVVGADRWQYPMTNSLGIVGWFVPAAVHVEMLEAIELLEYYRAKERGRK
jgi:hypothetical protein